MIEGNIQDTITNDFGKYKLGLITQSYRYYVNETEENENYHIIMTDKAGAIISNNYLSFFSYMEDILEIINGSCESEYIDEKFFKLAKEYLQHNNIF